MLRKSTTVRLEPTLQEGLEKLSKVLKRPMNQLVNEALQDYVSRRTHEVEQDLSKTLATLRAYRRRDPKLKRAITAAAKSEVQHAAEETVEGTVVVGDLVDRQLVAEAGPVQSENWVARRRRS